MQKITGLVASLSQPVLNSYIKNGSLEVVENGHTLVILGDGQGPEFTVSVDSPMTLWKMFSDPDLTCGEMYVDGKWDIVHGDLGQMLSWFCRNNREAIQNLPAPRTHINNPAESKKNVAHHYDLGNALYQSFLDPGMNYSCAFFDDHRMALRDAQKNKLFTTIQRLDVKPGMKVLDVGCGWGELSRLMQVCAPGAKVTGITLAENQIGWARQKSLLLGPNAPRYYMEDYRDHAHAHAGEYDRVVSVGMFEHVGREHFDEYFGAIHALLKPGAQALVHAIMRPEPGDATARWLDTYIFPGGCIPYMPEALEIADRNGLKATREPYIHDSFNYAETLRRWRQNFNAHADSLDPHKYDARFRRIWNYYLAMSEAAFDGMGYYVAQMILRKV